MEQRGESPGHALSVRMGGDNSQEPLGCSSLTLGRTCAGKTPGWAAQQAITKAKEFVSCKTKALRTEVVVVTGQQEGGERIQEGAGLITSGWKIPGPDAGA